MRAIPIVSFHTPRVDEAVAPDSTCVGSFDGDPAADWRIDLLRPISELVECLPIELEEGAFLNAFLIVVALQQAADDYLTSSSIVDRAADYLAQGDSAPATLAKRTLPPAARGVQRVGRLLRRRPGFTAWHSLVDELVADFARLAVEVGQPDEDASLTDRVRALAVAARTLPTEFRRAIPVLPSCFQTFDLQLPDISRLARLVGDALVGADRPVMLVGVRTSGSYLAPLLGVSLARLGIETTPTITMRPGTALSSKTRRHLRDAIERRATFIVTDDPPVSGSSLARAVDELVRNGVDREAIVLAYPRFTEETTKLRHLDDVRHVVLPWTDWEVHHRLTEQGVADDFGALLGGGVVVRNVTAVSQRAVTRADGHVLARYRVELSGQAAQPTRTLEIAVQGVGIGFYGEHFTEVARVLEHFAPRMYGLRSGLLYREWLDDDRRLAAQPGDSSIAPTLGRYVAQRSERLGVPVDRSREMSGDKPAWEAAAFEVSRAFGPAWPAAQFLVANRVTRAIMAVPRPTVVDGTTDLVNWFSGGDGQPGSVRTVGMQQRAYWHHGLSSYDPVFDLAGAVTSSFDVPDSVVMRAVYGDETGDRVSPERWLLLRLAQIWGGGRRRVDAVVLRRAASRVLQEYFAEVFLRNAPEAAADGPICALDVDGVLETDHLGFPSLTAASVSALRALRMHGYRAILVTGRGLDEVRDRCRNYGLVGGVAEYGSVAYVAATDTVIDLVTPKAKAELAALRRSLASFAGVVVDDHYGFGVRVWRDHGGVRRGLVASELEVVLADFPGLRAIEGEGQTDFVAAPVTKAYGLQRLIDEIVAPDAPASARVPALAIGDTVSDVSMLLLARARAVPAHASSDVDVAGVWRAPRPYQQGTLDAVDWFLGHRRSWLRSLGVRHFGSSGCAICQAPAPDRQRDALVAIVSFAEGGRHGMALRGLRALVLGLSLREP